MVRKLKRFWWLIQQIYANKYTIGAEIGCMNGNTSGRLLAKCPDLHLICVDLWEYRPELTSVESNESYVQWDFPKLYREFQSRIDAHKHRTTILRGISWEMANEVKDNSLDFVFIDADHNYDAVKKDIMAWTPKLKLGGLLSGHDINIPGVLKAVTELTANWVDTGIDYVWFCKKEDYEG